MRPSNLESLFRCRRVLSRCDTIYVRDRWFLTPPIETCPRKTNRSSSDTNILNRQMPPVKLTSSTAGHSQDANEGIVAVHLSIYAERKNEPAPYSVSGSIACSAISVFIQQPGEFVVQGPQTIPDAITNRVNLGFYVARNLIPIQVFVETVLLQ